MQGLLNIKHGLRSKSKDDFHNYFSELLGAVMDHFSPSQRLGELDRLGIDSFQYDSEDGRIQLAVQCKGFEKPIFAASQLKQCLCEIRKFHKSPIRVDAYWLVLNRDVTDPEQRASINAELDSLRKSGIAKKCVLLDYSRILPELQSHALAKLIRWTKQSREGLLDDYAERMAVVQYIPDVPVTFTTPTFNPSRLAFEVFKSYFASLANHKTGKYRNAPRLLLYSGFGFGKTSALHALARAWAEEGFNVLYIPAALLSQEAFGNGSGLATSLLSVLQPEDADVSSMGHDLLRNTLRQYLAKSKDWLLLIDGLDESASVLRAGALAALWNGIGDLGLPVLASVREELFELRKQDFLRDPQGRVGNTQPFFQTMRLTDWSTDLILQFIEQYPHRDRAMSEFAEFERTIRSDRYNDLYGDIPKRPLFLSMLAADAFSGKAPERELHRLYGSYFRRKFEIDRVSQAAMGAETRPSAIVERFGTQEAETRLIMLMERVARHIHRDALQTNERAVGSTSGGIAESTLKQLSLELDITDATLEDVVLHSLLRPNGRDPVTFKRLVDFSHRSFEEWFLARSLAQEPYAAASALEENTLTDGALKFLEAMQRDLRAGVALP